MEIMLDSRSYLEPHGIPLLSQGKVRDNYDLGDGRLLMVTTDRISTYDVVHPNGIPDKGKILAQLSAFWFSSHLIGAVCKNHLVYLVEDIFTTRAGPIHCPEISGRTLLIEKAKRVFPVECIVRGYITGSAWAEYLSLGGPAKGAMIAGVEYPSGLIESQELPEPIFTPTTKVQTGHDLNLVWNEFVGKVGGKSLALKLKELSQELYKVGSEYARSRGIIIADTKFEFGLDSEGELLLIDEVLTPDSSRFWDATKYEPGRPQRAMDKQFLRDWASRTGWDKKPPAPEIPSDIVETTAKRYREIFRRLTGRSIG